MTKLIVIGKKYTFDAAHQLLGHNGKCANIHGHTYTVRVRVKGTQLTGRDHVSDWTMVMDYYDLDQIVKPIIDMLDHSFMSAQKTEPIFNLMKYGMGLHSYFSLDDHRNAFERSLLMVVDEAFGKVVELPVQRTTAEELSTWLHEQIYERLRLRLNITALEVSVSETEKSIATYVTE